MGLLNSFNRAIIPDLTRVFISHQVFLICAFITVGEQAKN